MIATQIKINLKLFIQYQRKEKMKLIISVFVFTSMIVLLTSCGNPTKMSLKTDDDKAFYSMGAMFGQRLANLSLSENEINAIIKGLYDTAKNKKPEVEVMQYQKNIQDIIRDRMKKVAETEKNAGIKYLEDFLKKEGGQKTESGLAYKILEPGVGEKPNDESTVEVHYHGTLLDGTVFDSSKERGKPVEFPLNRVIKGWQEGLKLVAPGGKIKLVIPGDLAYGDQGAPPKIPGGATLVFDVELISIKTKDGIEKQRKEMYDKFKAEAKTTKDAKATKKPEKKKK